MAPLVCTAQLLQKVMNQQRVPAPANSMATALCSVNRKRGTVTRAARVRK